MNRTLARSRRIALAVVGLALTAATTSWAQSVPHTFDAAERIVAIGDIHGAHDTFVANLKVTGLIDDDENWVGGTAHLVQTGDVLDRGPDSRKAMDLLMKLERQAEAAGGKVHALIGNHEFWVAVGALDYVSKEELEAFEGERDEELRQQAGDDSARPGELALVEAFSSEGSYGQWIRQHNAAIRIGDLVFVHGGLTPEVAALGLTEINDRVRSDLDSPDWAYSFSMKEDGPLLTRRYSGEDLTEEQLAERGAEIRESLQTLGAAKMILGHTVTFGLIEPRFEGAAILIDSGMFEGYLGGHQAALVIENGSFRAVYEKGEVPVPDGLAGEDGARYIEASATASPDAPALKRRLGALRLEQGQAAEAARLYDEIGASDPESRLPYFWRREAAEAFESSGKTEEAKALYELYLRGMRVTAERAGEGGIPLLNAYARECLRLGLQTDEAFEAARQATAAYPKNMSFKVTIAWAWLAKGDPRRAVRVSSLAIRQGEDSALAFLTLGRARAAQGNVDQALQAFESARERDPDNEDVIEEIRKLESESNK